MNSFLIDAKQSYEIPLNSKCLLGFMLFTFMSHFISQLCPKNPGTHSNLRQLVKKLWALRSSLQAITYLDPGVHGPRNLRKRREIPGGNISEKIFFDIKGFYVQMGKRFCIDWGMGTLLIFEKQCKMLPSALFTALDALSKTAHLQ